MGEKGRLRRGDTELLRVSLKSSCSTLFQVRLEEGAAEASRHFLPFCLLGPLRVRGDLPHRLEGQALGSSHPALSPESNSPKWKKCSPSQGSGVQGQMHLWLSEPHGEPACPINPNCHPVSIRSRTAASLSPWRSLPSTSTPYT